MKHTTLIKNKTKIYIKTFFISYLYCHLSSSLQENTPKRRCIILIFILIFIFICLPNFILKQINN